MSAYCYDYIIVGGGTAGCVLAARLSEDPDSRVLLLEAGSRDWHPMLHMPAGYFKMCNGQRNWGLKTEPQRHANNRILPYKQARILGGGSSINAEIYTRGTPAEYDHWANELGCTGWGFRDVQRCFLRSEGNSTFAGEWHGTDGPLAVSDIPAPQRVTRRFLQACQEAGIVYNPDFNGPELRGCSTYQITARDGRRCSAAVGYLHPALGRPNLVLETNCTVQRVTFEGQRATGVEYKVSGRQRTARAEAEILLTAGAIGSPKVMMLSGVGPADHLRAHGIDVVLDAPGVGDNLTDHYGLDVIAELTTNDGLERYTRKHWAAWAGIQYLVFGTGPVTSNVVEGGAFWYSDAAQSAPDLQFHFIAAAAGQDGKPGVPKGSAGITINSYALHPKSRGTVRLRSADPEALPVVDPNYLAEPEDLKTTVEGVRMSREIFAQPSLGKHVRALRHPGADVRSQADLEAYVRAYGSTSYHPTSTCRMGIDNMAVVDPQLRVRGLEGLRICDSSIMPTLIGSNTNGPTVMIAERASELIRGLG